MTRFESGAWRAYCEGTHEARMKLRRKVKPLEDECDAEIAALWGTYLAATAEADVDSRSGGLA